MKVRFVSAAATHVGLIRERNEDAFAASDAIGFYAIADGMGGHPNGDVASATAVSAVNAFVRARLDAKTAPDLANWAHEAILAANAAVAARNEGLALAEQMGTTLCVAILSKDGGFALANVGDSRCYRVEAGHDRRGGRIDLITREDTVAADLIARGVPPALIRGSQQNTLTQAIGTQARLKPHVVTGALYPGDALVMCTDGVTNYMEEIVFRGTLMALHSDPEILCEALIRGALNGGGGDNCTCISILIEDAT